MAIYQIDLAERPDGSAPDNENSRIFYDKNSGITIQTDIYGVAVIRNKLDGPVATMYQEMIGGESKNGTAAEAPTEIAKLVRQLIRVSEAEVGAKKALSLVESVKKTAEAGLSDALDFPESHTVRYNYQLEA